jgi:hypothetical protein
MGETVMTFSSGTQRHQAEFSMPSLVPVQNGFGNGFRFNYDSDTSQAHWSRQKYYSAHDTKAEPQTQYDQLPAVSAQVASDENGLNIFDRLAFNVETSIRYHSRRHEHYERLFRGMMMAIMFLSSFAFVSGINNRALLGLCIVGLAAGTFVWNITNLSRLHDVIRAKYQSLFDHIRVSENPTENDMRHWCLIRMRIRSKEPPTFWAVANECHYETCRAWNLQPKQHPKLPWMLHIFKNWLRF